MHHQQRPQLSNLVLDDDGWGLGLPCTCVERGHGRRRARMLGKLFDSDVTTVLVWALHGLGAGLEGAELC